MNATILLDKLPLWGVFLASLTITFLSMQFGFRIGKLRREKHKSAEEIKPGPLVAASLSLLAFMLAMVFGAAQSRFREVKQVALNEANAIGTAYLRADLLPASDRADIRQLLNDYLTLRINAVEDGTEQQLQEAIDRSQELHGVLWYKAATIANQQPSSTTTLFVRSVNEVIALHHTRVTLSIHYRLVGVIWIVLFGLAVLAMAMGGYATALPGGTHLLGITLPAALAFSVVFLLVVALDRPHDHLAKVTQAVMLDQQESMRR